MHAGFMSDLKVRPPGAKARVRWGRLKIDQERFVGPWPAIPRRGTACRARPVSVILRASKTDMAFSPDIIVTGEDTPGILLAAEARLSRSGRKEDESQLKTYMLDMRCPIGLLVTPDVIEVFRDTYTAHSEKSVEHVASFASPKTWKIFKGPLRNPIKSILAFRFEEAVKSWLEQLATSPTAYLNESKETREALTDYILPALAQGVVRSTGPRESVKSH
jgi:hypothetical protein